MVPRKFWSTKDFVQKSWVPKYFGSKIIWVTKFEYKKAGQKNLGQKKI